MTLELSLEEARFLSSHLARHIDQVDAELVHTDSRALQREIVQDLDHLRAIARKLERLIDADEAAAA
jgi:hypothetical protein